MKTTRLKILVATDFSVGADLAFGEAMRLARRAGGEVDVVHVVPSSVEAPVELIAAGPSHDLPGIGDARMRLEDHFSYGAVEEVPLRAHVRMGRPPTELLAAIDELAPDLVVLGSRGHGKVARALLGSVSDEVWQKSRAQVLIVPPTRVRDFARNAATKRKIAWSCRQCGHILASGEGTTRCTGCGQAPARFWGAPIEHGAVDGMAPAVGHAAGDVSDEGHVPTSASSISVGPAGTSGYDVNPELRVRY